MRREWRCGVCPLEMERREERHEGRGERHEGRWVRKRYEERGRQKEAL